jgi:hypothetical protein
MAVRAYSTTAPSPQPTRIRPAFLHAIEAMAAKVDIAKVREFLAAGRVVDAIATTNAAVPS